MKYLPIGLDVRHKTCVVVGGGPIGERKVGNLLRASAHVVLVSPEATESLSLMADAGSLRWVRREFRESDLQGAYLVVAATNDDQLNARVVDGANTSGVLVCDASSAPRSEVIFGALHQQEGLTVAVFTDGEDPSRARSTRDRIAEALSDGDREPPAGD
jgi:siroheme synthase-like protein